MSQKDDYGRHEVLHMSSFLERVVSLELLDHHQIIENEEWCKLAHKAQDALWELYQAIGKEHFKDVEMAEK